jgi:hypothetical protein
MRKSGDNSGASGFQLKQAASSKNTKTHPIRPNASRLSDRKTPVIREAIADAPVPTPPLCGDETSAEQLYHPADRRPTSPPDRENCWSLLSYICHVPILFDIYRETAPSAVEPTDHYEAGA